MFWFDRASDVLEVFAKLNGKDDLLAKPDLTRNSIALFLSCRGTVKINQLLNQEEGCTIEELLMEEEKLVMLCRGGREPKLIEFVC